MFTLNYVKELFKLLIFAIIFYYSINQCSEMTWSFENFSDYESFGQMIPKHLTFDIS